MNFAHLHVMYMIYAWIFNIYLKLAVYVPICCRMFKFWEAEKGKHDYGCFIADPHS